MTCIEGCLLVIEESAYKWIKTCVEVVITKCKSLNG